MAFSFVVPFYFVLFVHMQRSSASSPASSFSSLVICTHLEGWGWWNELLFRFRTTYNANEETQRPKISPCSTSRISTHSAVHEPNGFELSRTNSALFELTILVGGWQMSSRTHWTDSAYLL